MEEIVLLLNRMLDLLVSLGSVNAGHGVNVAVGLTTLDL